jgi:hypothetical protein
MKKLVLSAVIGLSLLLSLPAESNAAYDSSSDLTISIDTQDFLQFSPSGSTGDATFELQEGAHTTLTNETGVELDHSYIWIEVNGVKILAIDPIKPTF